MAARSSLEEMLESLQRRDDKPSDLPPVLPSRPSSKARLPSFRKSLPVNFKVGDENGGIGGLVCKDDILRSSRGSFGSRKKTKVDQPGESPYAGMMGEKKRDDWWMKRSVSDLQSVSSTRCREIEYEDEIEYFIKKKLNVWCRQSSGLWVLGRIQSTSGDKVLILLSDGRVTKGLKGDLFPANPDILDGVDDLMQLNFLNEPSFLHNLQCRYSKESIYCKAGPLLISVNPFKDLQIYENDAVTAYKHKFVDIPHVYAVVNAAYTDMVRDGRNQSIILSGESGAGKTETAKYAMNYLTSVSDTRAGLERRIKQSSNILEAFGNARTMSNDNATRFGKLTETYFAQDGKISCYRVQTFFLEKSRVVLLANGERSFHIFYQLCAGATPSLKAKLNLKAANFYNYLSRSDSMRIDELEDERHFQTLLEALDVVQISKDDQEHVFAMVAAVLWLGNISFNDGENRQVEVLMDEAVSTVSRLLGCSLQDLIAALSSKADGSNKLTFQQATASRDAFASYLYASLFEWLVEKINQSFEAGKGYSGNTISILDMFGYGTTTKNSLEQIFINYANERLQEHYNRHIFKLVQEDLELEGIDYNKFDFQDNQDCLSLFEKPPGGFFSLLNEESILAKTSDLKFANRLKQHLSGNPCYKCEQGGKLTVRHCFGEVTYDMDGILTKNMNSMQQNLIQLLASCSCSLPELFASKLPQQHDSESPSSEESNCLSSSMGTVFKGQLFNLIQQLEFSRPRFILCIRPNSKQLPEMFEKEHVSKQLRCHKVVEAVRMHRCGYPTRMTHQEFATRFRFLLGDADTVSEDPLTTSITILQQYRIHPTSYQVGYTKLFFRPGQIDGLEALNSHVLEGALEVHKLFPKPCTCRNLKAMKAGVITLQSFIRGENARREYGFLVKLSSKELLSLRAFQENQKTKVIQLQSAIRGLLARQQFIHLRNAKRLSSGSSQKHIGIKTAKGLPEENAAVSPSVMQDIRVQLVKAEATLGQKEEENAALRQQLQQLQSKWSGHEAKMKTMEDAWKQQITSLQASLTAAKKSIAADNPSTEPRRFVTSPSPLLDSEDTVSKGSQNGAASPMPYVSFVQDGHPGRENNGKATPISHLVNEFDQKKHNFDKEAKSLESGSLHNPEQQLQQLKLRFAQWKKDYKIRLREAKAKLRKQGHTDMERSHRKWWGKKHRKPSS